MLKINLRKEIMDIKDLKNYVIENNIKWYLESKGWVELSDDRWLNTKDRSTINGSFRDIFKTEKDKHERSKVS